MVKIDSFLSASLLAVRVLLAVRKYKIHVLWALSIHVIDKKIKIECAGYFLISQLLSTVAVTASSSSISKGKCP